MKNSPLISLFLCLFAGVQSYAANVYTVTSPDASLKAEVTVDKEITYSVFKDTDCVLAPSAIAMQLSDGSAYDGSVRLRKVSRSSVDRILPAICYKKSQVRENYNELTLSFKTFDLMFRAYDDGPTAFPWRIINVSSEDKDILENDLVWLLGTPADPQTDWSWIKPGKVAWEWWNDWNITGVDFKAGVNNDTYKYYIDFASRNGIEYVILDEGWAVNKKADLFQVVPEIDLEELVAYGAERNVGIVLWAGYWAFERDMEKICEVYSKMGIKGWKIDFMDRDDQIMVDFYRRAAATAARYGQFIDFHGAYKPCGLNRTYPNVINYEGVYGLENMKWAKPDSDQVTYDVTLPFIRMAAGPMDYTQGAMLNAGKVGDYVAVARRRGDTWYVGGLTDWEARSLELDLGFLGKGDWQVEIFTDGVNVSRNATDYKVSRFNAGNVLKVDMASGGGFAARITKRH